MRESDEQQDKKKTITHHSWKKASSVSIFYRYSLKNKRRSLQVMILRIFPTQVDNVSIGSDGCKAFQKIGDSGPIIRLTHLLSKIPVYIRSHPLLNYR